ncbi:N-acetylmuramoyl-L-alanine amidase CwlD [Halalkalibacterium halodurans]|uniref:Germination specific N-acetylmuramoyl-L-alanine amidase n=1 Tax=Halalkalibacterium halodurans (strain ATCC BAA-125 / DSM 18197 / FERM 7344 / JCM 9153 / C-125) TaxID=272558 RepID=Q9KG73_HALH5|nr:N-acetylmuramoyl-L-alanine amidase CwlD [Halalkalibacterium halodurans]MED4082832.1 N-acetylmuramoyl-L-alanine amidase CwlD [Halalkalibacterium halodurans]MED4083249.1 N-acetylmuramoyl-L-alanine amidase CwlD [Halalkalibacterium halodurans]MED4105222.1 N-acetylmuramoyl-L-alanine amidase CwlD [Halalkalibacterium halodurans]MED4110639.1 N-acetylmuramoyl-L-alanine amidase CwlD [Halalkalibacterium halodurans]MED4151040.1 N-acetylmuramoyl-L-alanine amidase CwlD [Halalkalibacterium halodurans]
MIKWLKGGVFALGLVALLFIIQYQFISNDSSSTWNLPLSGKVIILDPGHGGIDGGATSRAGALEKDITLAVSLELRDYLQEAGALVLMTREEDRDLADATTAKVRQRKVQDLKRRVEIVNGSGADMFVSIHLNAIASPRWSGAQTFYNRAIPENEPLARFVQDQLKRNLENTSRYAKPINNVFLLKHAEIPGLLVEAGFLSNPSEAELLETEDYQQKVAASIYQGIMRYYTNEDAPEQ